MKYAVNFIFNPDCTKVLLVHKDRTLFKDRWNGVGGKFQEGENAVQCAYREVREETGLPKTAFIDPCPAILGELYLHDDCASDEDVCELHYLAFRTDDLSKAKKQEGDTEDLGIFDVEDVLNTPVTNNTYARNGDLQMFVLKACIHYGFRRL